MKKMTCKMLAGACDEVFEAATFEEISEMSKKHGMEMFQKGDEAHLKAMEKMKEMVKASGNEQEAYMAWYQSKKKEFDELPES